VAGTTTTWAWRIARVVVFLVYAVFLVYITILSTAFILRLFGANPQADFANWIYTASDRIMEPFRGIFPTQEITDRAVFDASLLFAIIVYSLLGVGLGALVDWVSRHLQEAERRDKAQAAAAANAPAPLDEAMPYPGPPGQGWSDAHVGSDAVPWAPSTAPPQTWGPGPSMR
jgi:uncharacterized protein YggT (Ycf19 family)